MSRSRALRQSVPCSDGHVRRASLVASPVPRALHLPVMQTDIAKRSLIVQRAKRRRILPRTDLRLDRVVTLQHIVPTRRRATSPQQQLQNLKERASLVSFGQLPLSIAPRL